MLLSALAAMVLALGLLSGLPGAAIAQDEAAVTVLDVRFGDHSTKLRMVLDITGQPEFEISYSADPMAVIVDFPDLALEAPPRARGIRFIEGYEIGRRIGGGTRIRLTLSQPARASQVFYLPETPAEAPRFVLDLAPTNAADLEMLAGIADEPETAPEELVVAEGDGGDPVPPEDPVAEILQTASLIVPSPEDMGSLVPPTAEPRPDEPAAAPDSEAAPDEAEEAISLASMPIPKPKPEPPALPLIVLDPGHGGYDPGAVSANGVREKDITLKAARVLSSLLERTGRYDVELTREDDRFMALRDRVNVARQAGASMFLSLHADSIDDPTVRGASVYTLSEVASDREAEALAARENRSGALTGVRLDEQDDDMTVSILIDLAQRQSRSYSSRLADLVITAIGDVQPMVGNTHRQAGFAVLTAPDVPSVLVELGYLSSRDDVQMLRDERHVARLMSAIAGSIDGYFNWQASRYHPE